MYESPAIGGTGMPQSLGAAYIEFISAAINIAHVGSSGSRLNDAHCKVWYRGTKKDLYTKNDERRVGRHNVPDRAHAGSDVGRLSTKAVKQEDGTYRNRAEDLYLCRRKRLLLQYNHPVLARIEGDPEGTKGISIFIVPKYLVDSEGNIIRKMM
jgi:alkylation response protein AidB-like acyl-CoA dehydrogenase